MAAEIVDALNQYGKYDLPDNVRRDVEEYVSRHGGVTLTKGEGHHLLLTSHDPALLVENAHHKTLAPFVLGRAIDGALIVEQAQRGHVKQALQQFGYLAEDLAGYVDGGALAVHLRTHTASEEMPFALRHHQDEAVAVFHAGRSARGGSGVIVQPGAAGRTLVGLGILAELQCNM